MCTPINCSARGRQFGPNGCQVPVGNGVCGEKRTLDFINEFKKLYEQKMEEIDAHGGGDCLQEKFRLQQEWIENLIEQNEMLVRAVGELEVEATERVQMLEEKLQKSAKCICEVMNKYRQYDVTNEILTEPLEKIFRLENDQKNLLEFIRRIRENATWDFEGLNFFEISYKDLFGNDLIEHFNDKNRYLNNNDDKKDQALKMHESTIEDLRRRVDYLNSFGNVEIIARDLKSKTEECETLRQSMIEMRQVLTEEVASKHDTILQLKREIQQLEEKCIQSDKQTAFRDDIVKELRKEIKQLKQQLTQEEVIKLHDTINGLQNNLERTKQLQEDEEKRKRLEMSNLLNTIENLKKNLKEAEDKAKICKICRGRSKVGFVHSTEVQASLDQEQIQQQMELLQHRDEIIKVQTNTLGLLQNELQCLKERDAEMRHENEKQYNEISFMKNKIEELENELVNAETKTANLQAAVNLYLNSINVLEASEEKHKIELDQQKATITSLRSALVTTKNELDGIKHKSNENVSFNWAAKWFGYSEPKPQNITEKSVHDV